MSKRDDAAKERAWKMLRAMPKMGVQFQRAFAIGNDVVDFANPKRRFIVEVGGLYDALRDDRLKRAGYMVWRVDPAEVAKERWVGEVQRLVEARPEKAGERRAPVARAKAEANAPFWKTKTLEQMTDAEWESLCDGCGKCCLIGLEDEDTGVIHLTDVSCKLLDGDSCRCSNYENRKSIVSDCVKLTAKNVPDLYWLPKTCGYRLVAQGEDLKWWHPLVSGNPETVHAANVSVRGKVRKEKPRQSMKSLIMAITDWPQGDDDVE